MVQNITPAKAIKQCGTADPSVETLFVMEQVLKDLQSYLYALMYAPFYDIYHPGHHS